MSKTKTLRVTEFKGLNKATNPHNIDDAELVTLENMFVTKNRGLESRKGYRRLGDVDAGSNDNFIKSIFATAWSSTDERLYYAGNGYLGKMASDGTASFVAKTDDWGKTAQFDRYKDKVLFLNQESYLQWFNADETLELVKYPELQAAPGSFETTITADNTESSSLTHEAYYQYCISLVLGDDYKDGESMASKPSDGYFVGKGMLSFPISASHPFGSVTDNPDRHRIVGTAVEFGGPLHGYNIGMVKLYRRHAVGPLYADITAGDPVVLSGHGEWRLLDTVTVDLDVAAGTYAFGYSSKQVVTDITGTLVSDVATLYVSWVDRGSVIDTDGVLTDEPNGELESPWEEPDVVVPRASHMARLYNRVFLANIVGSGQPRDSKKVYYSYRGLIPDSGKSEIEGVAIPDAMLIFPVLNNYFYCDAEDVEDPITAITSFRDSIIVFTERCMFLWREGIREPIKISNDIGCIAKRSVVEFEGKLLWLAHTGVFMYDGSKVTNMTVMKMQPYIDDLPRAYAHSASAAVYDRKYFIAGQFEGGTLKDMMLVYDFDVESWHTRKYLIGSSETCYIDVLYTDRDGADEQLWAGIKDPSANVDIAQMETGYLDQQNPEGGDTVLSISCSVKTKYYSFKAPDIEKAFRDLLLDVENYYGDITLSVFIDDLLTAKETFTHSNNVDGFTLDSATQGVLGVTAPQYYLAGLSDEILRLSLPRGLVGSRMQYSADMIANTSPLYIHLVGFDWTPKRQLKRRYGA